MYSIEKISNKVSNKIAIELNLDNNKRAVINYGIFAFSQMLLSIVLVGLFGFIFDVFIEAIIIFITISVLRQKAGGVHASSPGICTFVGTVLSVGMGLAMKNIDINIRVVIAIGCVIFVWSYYTTYKLAPVDSIAKPIKKLEKRKRLKKSSMLILTVYLVIVIVNIIGYYATQNANLLVYSGCIYIGLLWQIFSLTKSGHVVLGKLDTFFK